MTMTLAGTGVSRSASRAPGGRDIRRSALQWASVRATDRISVVGLLIATEPTRGCHEDLTRVVDSGFSDPVMWAVASFRDEPGWRSCS
jgi:hypothetical protein